MGNIDGSAPSINIPIWYSVPTISRNANDMYLIRYVETISIVRFCDFCCEWIWLFIRYVLYILGWASQLQIGMYPILYTTLVYWVYSLKLSALDHHPWQARLPSDFTTFKESPMKGWMTILHSSQQSQKSNDQHLWLMNNCNIWLD